VEKANHTRGERRIGSYCAMGGGEKALCRGKGKTRCCIKEEVFPTVDKKLPPAQVRKGGGISKHREGLRVMLPTPNQREGRGGGKASLLRRPQGGGKSCLKEGGGRRGGGETIEREGRGGKLPGV